MKSRLLVSALSMAVAAGAVASMSSAHAQQFPNKPLRIVVPPGSMLDPAPRVLVDPELGVCTVGRSAKDAQIVFDIYAHTMDVIERAALLEQVPLQALSVDPKDPEGVSGPVRHRRPGSQGRVSPL